MWQDLERDGRGDLEWNFHQSIPEILGARDWGESSTRTGTTNSLDLTVLGAGGGRGGRRGGRDPNRQTR